MSTTTKQSTIIHSKNVTSRNLATICKLTGMSHEDIFWMQVDTGIAFLKIQCRGDKWGIDHMKQNTVFWSWWVNLWNQRDDAFVIRYATQIAHKTYHENTCRYMLNHNLSLLYKTCNSKILDEGYALVIRISNKERQLQTYETTAP
jgi:hypothetical protein